MKKILAAPFAVTIALAASAALEPVSPAGENLAAMQTPESIAVLSQNTYTGRVSVLKAKKKEFAAKIDSKWRKAPPVKFVWRTTAGEGGPWKILVSKDPDFKNPQMHYAHHAGHEKSKGAEKLRSLTLDTLNLETGATYWWKVCSKTNCKDPAHGTPAAGCKCAAKHPGAQSAPAKFKTADMPPRWIAVEGRVKNIRDLGGWKTDDGRRVKQGLVFRGQGLNDNSANGAVSGRNRLMVEDVKLLRGVLGIKTDLDLRSGRETACMKSSPLGEDVNFVHHSSEHYSRLVNKDGKKNMAENFRVFTDEKNYPIYFHCIAGADRTGSLAYTLLAVLGVSGDDASKDWECTFYPDLPELHKSFSPKYWRRIQHVRDGLAKYGNEGSTLKERAELYLLDCGITREEIEKFRSIMLK